MAELQLLRDDVAVRRLPDRGVTTGGVLIPQRAVEDAFMRGVVTRTGPGYVHPRSGKYVAPIARRGQRVVFAAEERRMAQHSYRGEIILQRDRLWGVLEE